MITALAIIGGIAIIWFIGFVICLFAFKDDFFGLIGAFLWPLVLIDAILDWFGRKLKK